MKKTQIILPCLLFAMFLLFTQPLQSADYTNSIGMKFKKIPAGSFYMGSCKLTDAQLKADKKANKKRKFMGLSEVHTKAACPLVRAQIMTHLRTKHHNIKYASANHFK